MPFDMQINQIIQHRRSHFVKEFTGDILPDVLINRLLENARWAPSHKLTMPWKLKVFGGSEKFDQNKIDKIRTYKDKISHIISIGFKPSGLVPEWEELAATAMAVQNMWLTLTEEPHAAGYWTSGNGTGSEEMKLFTGLKKDDIQMGFFFLGYVEEKRFEAVRE